MAICIRVCASQWAYGHPNAASCRVQDMLRARAPAHWEGGAASAEELQRGGGGGGDAHGLLPSAHGGGLGGSAAGRGSVSAGVVARAGAPRPVVVGAPGRSAPTDSRPLSAAEASVLRLQQFRKSLRYGAVGGGGGGGGGVTPAVRTVPAGRSVGRAGNALDSSASVMVRRGKERRPETQRPKRLSTLKKIILRERVALW